MLLGELLLLEGALAERGVVSLPRPAVLPPLSWIACEGHEDVIVDALRKRFAEGKWGDDSSSSSLGEEKVQAPWSLERVVSLGLYGWDPRVLARQAAWEAAPSLLGAAEATPEALYELLVTRVQARAQASQTREDAARASSRCQG